MSAYGSIQPYPGDPILSLYEEFRADPRPGKVNLGIGVYTDGNGEIPTLRAVRSAHEQVRFAARSYLPMEGHAAFRKLATELVFGAGHPAVEAGQIASVQTVGGTGGVSLAAEFLAKHCPGRTAYVSDPAWDNHHGLFNRSGLPTRTYRYWDAQRRAVDADGMVHDLRAAPAGSLVVIQPVCHNPTGADIDAEQQARVIEVLLERGHIAVFDMAYQGFGSSIPADAAFVRRYAEASPLGGALVVSSFSKTFSLYGERCGLLCVLCRDTAERELVLGQLKLAVRQSYSSPPATAAELIATVLGSAELRADWEEEVGTMRARMAAMREALVAGMSQRSNAVDASFLLAQRGMFGFTGLTEERVRTLKETEGIYLLPSGRICVAGLNERNIDRVSEGLTWAMGRATGHAQVHGRPART